MDGDCGNWSDIGVTIGNEESATSQPLIVELLHAKSVLSVLSSRRREDGPCVEAQEHYLGKINRIRTHPPLRSTQVQNHPQLFFPYQVVSATEEGECPESVCMPTSLSGRNVQKLQLSGISNYLFMPYWLPILLPSNLCCRCHQHIRARLMWIIPDVHSRERHMRRHHTLQILNLLIS